MDNKYKFQELLGDILEVARVQGNQLGMNEIRELFGDMNLSESQYEHIFAYLAANQIAIKGYAAGESEYTKAVQNEREREREAKEEERKGEKKADDKKQDNFHNREEDSAYLRMYLEDLREIKEISPEEEQLLIDKIVEGDHFSRNRYIEGKLHYVVKIAAEYKDCGVSMEDLIQEGNMGLLSFLEALSELRVKKQEKAVAADYIKKFMEAAISEQKENSSFEKEILKKINFIRDAAAELAQDLGREADIHELAGYVNMTEKEIDDIIHMSVEGVNLEEHHSSLEGQHDHDHFGHQH